MSDQPPDGKATNACLAQEPDAQNCESLSAICTGIHRKRGVYAVVAKRYRFLLQEKV